MCCGLNQAVVVLVGTPSGALASYSSGGGYSSSLSLSQGGGTLSFFVFFLNSLNCLCIMLSTWLNCSVASAPASVNRAVTVDGVMHVIRIPSS